MGSAFTFILMPILLRVYHKWVSHLKPLGWKKSVLVLYLGKPNELIAVHSIVKM